MYVHSKQLFGLLIIIAYVSRSLLESFIKLRTHASYLSCPDCSLLSGFYRMNGKMILRRDALSYVTDIINH